jgi:hypothetical protein
MIDLFLTHVLFVGTQSCMGTVAMGLKTTVVGQFTIAERAMSISVKHLPRRWQV